MLTKIDDLAFEIKGDTITLEQDAGCGDVHMVTIHAIHLRHFAESMGMVKAVDASGAELMRDIDRYKRALLAMRGRAEQLYDNLCTLVDKEGVEAGIEIAQAAALSDFAEHICIEFEDQYHEKKAAPVPPTEKKRPKAAKQEALALEVQQ